MSLETVISKYNSLCIQDELLEAYKFLAEIKNPNLNVIKFRKRVENRFFSDNPKFRFKTKIKWIRKTLLAYYFYYISVLTKTISIEKAEKNLAKNLSESIFHRNIDDLNEIEELLAEKFKEIGWYFLGGVTLPFRGPYIYEELEEKECQIELPSGIRSLPVKFMKKFHSLSWLDFATFGKQGTGGWAKDDGIYCVIEKYDENSEDFRINYLKHEAQHLDDYIRFPFLKENHQSTLEFRAKLIELIYAESLNSFSEFMSQGKNDSNYPHLFASYHIKKSLMNKLNILEESNMNNYNDFENIKLMALELFNESNEKIKNGETLG